MNSLTPPTNDIQIALESIDLDDYGTVKLTLNQLAYLGYKKVILQDDLSNLNDVSDFLEEVLNGHTSS